MNGFNDHGLDEAAFGEKKGFTEGLRTFDAFRTRPSIILRRISLFLLVMTANPPSSSPATAKTKPTYTRRSSTGGYTTLFLLLASALLAVTEFRRWYRGHETHLFSVEKGVSHELQINLDIVVPMGCADLHINVQDASGDRILAGDMLRKDPTNWNQWVNAQGVHLLDHLSVTQQQELERDTHPGHVLNEVRRTKRKFRRTPRGGRGSCRIFGTLAGNKVQGDFHITARGHGYMEFGEHLDHHAFNFSHIINELSFGPLYPTLLNPLDRTFASTTTNFQKYQYYLSLVPTVYTRWPPSTSPRSTVFTNQYAVTSSSQIVPEQAVPGIFFKFDIEPILLTVMEEREGLLRLVIRVVNVVSGVFVAGGWVYQLVRWGREVVLGGRGRKWGGGENGGGLLLHEKRRKIGGVGVEEEEDEE